MGKALINDTTMTNIANAVRSKFGLTGQLKHGDMLAALQGVKKPGSYVWSKFDFKHGEKGEILGYVVGDNESDYPDKAAQGEYYYELVFPVVVPDTPLPGPDTPSTNPLELTNLQFTNAEGEIVEGDLQKVQLVFYPSDVDPTVHSKLFSAGDNLAERSPGDLQYFPNWDNEIFGDNTSYSTELLFDVAFLAAFSETTSPSPDDISSFTLRCTESLPNETRVAQYYDENFNMISPTNVEIMGDTIKFSHAVVQDSSDDYVVYLIMTPTNS